MAWGRKAYRIADLEQRFRKLEASRDEYRHGLHIAQAEGDVARIDAKAFKRSAADLEHVARERREALTDREQEIRALKDRQRELEWAVHLLNGVLSNKVHSSIGTPVTAIMESTMETAREAVRERDIVVKWDDLTGKPEVHFPKKDERRAPWARATGGFLAGTVYPTVSDPLFAPRNPFPGSPT